MFASQIDDWPVVVDDALRDLWDELDARCDPVLNAALEAAMEESLADQLAADPGPEPWCSALEDEALGRELARTRALLAGAVADRDDAAGRVEALTSRLGEAQDAVSVARTELRVARHELGLARAEAVRAVGERDLARADLAHATDSHATGTHTGDIAHAPSDPTPTGQGPAGGVVAGLADGPGPALAGVLGVLVGDLALTPGSGPGARVGCLDGLADTDVVEAAVAAQRLAGWAGALQAAAAGHLRDRWAATAHAGNDEALWTTAAEIGLACGLSRHAAADLLNTARHLPTRMPTLWALFAAGHLDLVKANLVTGKTLALTPDVAAVVEAGILDRVDPARSGDTAPITRPQLEALLDRLVAAATPEAEEEIATECRARRGVRFRALAHGMGQMTLITGAEETEAARAALNDLTHAARARGRVGDPDDPHARCDPDGRHPSATRADVLSDLITGTAAAPAACDDSVAAADLPSTDQDFVAEADGSEAASAAADDAGPATDSVGADDTPDSAPATDTAPGTAADDAALGSHAGAAFRVPSPNRRRRTEIVVLVPLSVLTGASDQPATLAGYGPIPAQLARELATTGHWRCAAIDDREGSPTHGTLLGLGRSTYTPAYSPGPGLRRFIEIRDQTCAFPGCRHPAVRSEHDHRTPWAATDTGDATNVTCECNLHCLCVHHHRLKHRGGITAYPAPGAGTTWTMPTGRTYTTRAEPLA